jgi:16S rRNA (adenine1518-N6/adenine1519-N6)-dimethyltransferase
VTLTRREVLDLLRPDGIRLSKALGQNFVVDPNTVRRIARLAAVGPGDRVLEIGAGLGSLTLALAETGATVTAVELDKRLAPLLRGIVEPVGVEVVEGDAMTLDWSSVLAGSDAWVLVANLPYNVATPLVADLLDGVPAIRRMLVMVQKEAGERLAAAPGSDAYGAVSVKVAYWARASVASRVPRSVFFPEPNVDSVLVSIERRDEPAVTSVPAPALFDLVRVGFGQRRKMLRKSLAGLVTAEGFSAADVRPEARPEELDVHAWGRLAACATSSGPPPS